MYLITACSNTGEVSMVAMEACETEIALSFIMSQSQFLAVDFAMLLSLLLLFLLPCKWKGNVIADYSRHASREATSTYNFYASVESQVYSQGCMSTKRANNLCKFSFRLTDWWILLDALKGNPVSWQNGW